MERTIRYPGREPLPLPVEDPPFELTPTVLAYGQAVADMIEQGEPFGRLNGVELWHCRMPVATAGIPILLIGTLAAFHHRRDEWYRERRWPPERMFMSHEVAMDLRVAAGVHMEPVRKQGGS